MKKHILLITLMLLTALASMSCNKERPVHQTDTRSNARSTSGNDSISSGKTKTMNIKMTIGGQTITATMENNGAARDLMSRLPMTVTLSDFNRTEKIFYPEPPLSLSDTPRGCAPVPGDITIYEPWGNVAIFYKSWEHSRDLIKIGHLDGNGINVLSSQSGNVEVKIERQ